MKIINKLFAVAFAALFSFAFVACDDIPDGNDSNDGVVDDGSTENNDATTGNGADGLFVCDSIIAGLDMALLDNQESVIGSFNIKADVTLDITSDKSWLTLSATKDGEYYIDIRVNAGKKQTIYVKATDSGREFDAETATLSTEVEGEKYVIATVLRSGKDCVIKVYDKEEAVIDSLITDTTVMWIRPEANFGKCLVYDYPEWLMEPVAENEGYSFSVKEGMYHMALAGEICLGDSTKKVVKLPVKYDDPYYASITCFGVDASGEEQLSFDWDASVDGKTFTKEESTPDGETEYITVNNYLTAHIYTRDYLCRFVCIDEVYQKGDWIKVKQDAVNKYDYKITVDALGSSVASRSGYLFALPENIYNGFEDSLTEMANSGMPVDSLLEDYEKYSLIHITQEDAGKTKGFTIVDAANSENNVESGEFAIEYTSILDLLESEFFANSGGDITTCEVVPGESYELDTKIISLGVKKDCNMYRIADTTVAGGEGAIDYKHNKEVEEAWGMQLEAVKNGNYIVKFTVPADQTSNVVLRMSQGGNQNLKVLFIRIKK